MKMVFVSTQEVALFQAFENLCRIEKFVLASLKRDIEADDSFLGNHMNLWLPKEVSKEEGIINHLDAILYQSEQAYKNSLTHCYIFDYKFLNEESWLCQFGDGSEDHMLKKLLDFETELGIKYSKKVFENIKD